MLTLKILFWAMLLIVFYTYIGYGILLYIIIRLKRLFRGTPLKAAMPSDEELEKLCPWNPECKEALEDLHRQHQKEIFDAM